MASRNLRVHGGGLGTLYSVSFTTNASGVPTLDDDFGGTISIAESANDYTITLPESFDTAVVVPVATAGTINGFSTDSAARTVTIETTAGIDSATVQLLIVVTYNSGN